MGLLSGLLGGNLGGKQLVAKVTTMDADLESIPIVFQRDKLSELTLEPDWTGRDLFDLVCRIIGLREFWFFGLQYENKKNISCWLQMDKKISKQDVPKGVDGHLHFLFLVKFYPEDVEEELIQDLTRHLFFVQIKQAILTQDLYCSAEAAVLLASYGVQAIHGDCAEDAPVDVAKYLPANVTSQYDMTVDMWQERIRRWWTHNAGQSREDAEMEYLRVAQDLEMYGIQYYPIQNKKETDLQLGVSAQGIGIYKGANRITPRPFFSWSEIRNISFKNKQFNMKTVDKSTISFQAKDHSINMSILELCIGTHNLYLRRRQPDILEVQQMKAQAKEERIRKQDEQNRLQKEREERMQAETERNQLRNDMQTLNEQLHLAQEQARKSDENATIFSTKARTAEDEIKELLKRAEDAEQETQRMKITYLQCDGMRRMMEEEIREKELAMQRMSMSIGDMSMQNWQQPRQTAHFASQAMMGQENGWMLHNGNQPMSNSHHDVMSNTSSADEEREAARQWDELQRAQRSASTQPMLVHTPQIMPNSTPRSPPPYIVGSQNGQHSGHPIAMIQQQLQHQQQQQQQQQHQQQQQLPPPPQMIQLPPPPPLPSQQSPFSLKHLPPVGPPPPDPSAFDVGNLPNEIAQLKNTLDKSKLDYNNRTKHFKATLQEFRTELEGLKREERVTELDRAHAANLGRDRGDTLRMSASGSMQRRIATFEGL